MLLGATLAAQSLPTDREVPRAIAAVCDDLSNALKHPDPVVRGEAALALALTRDARHYDAILAVASDRRALDARLRGIVALGYLGAPGAESFLGDILLESDRRSAEAAAAALAIGLLPDDRTVPALHTYQQTIAGSYRRHRDNLASWLFALTLEPHPSSASRVVALLEDHSNHQPELRRLAMRALAAIPARVTVAAIEPWLDSAEEHERVGALEAAASSDVALSPAELERLAVAATRDRQPRARAAALRLLTHHRYASALEIAVRAVRSSDRHEIAAGLDAARRLGGAATRAAMETMILDERDADLQAAMLAGWNISVSENFLDGCVRLASERRADVAVRVEAAALAARSKDSRSRPVLRALFVEVEDPALLRTLASAMCSLDPMLLALDRIYPPTSAADLRLMPARVGALIACDHPAAPIVLSRALRAADLDGDTAARLIQTLRTTVSPAVDPELVALLPPALQAIYR